MDFITAKLFNIAQTQQNILHNEVSKSIMCLQILILIGIIFCI